MRAVATVSGKAIQSPWFTAEEAAAYLRFESGNGTLHAFYLAYPRMGIIPYRLRGGRQLRFHQDDLDRALELAKRHVPQAPGAQDGERKLNLASLSSTPAATWTKPT